MDRVPGFEPGGWRFEPSSVQVLLYQTRLKLILTGRDKAQSALHSESVGSSLLKEREVHRLSKVAVSQNSKFEANSGLL